MNKIFFISIIAVIGALAVIDYRGRWNAWESVTIESRAYNRYFSSPMLKEFTRHWPDEERGRMRFSRNTSLGVTEDLNFQTSLDLEEVHQVIEGFIDAQSLHPVDPEYGESQRGKTIYEFESPEANGSMGQIVVDEGDEAIEVSFVSI